MTLAILAHQAVAPSDLAGTWTLEPAVVASLVAAGALYGRGAGRLRRRIPELGVRRAAAFYAGLAVVAVALLSPVDAAASSLFAGHMVQHLLLMVVAAPLLAWARPVAALVAGLPSGGRDVARGPGARRVRRTLHVLMHPVTVWTFGALALWAWHMPTLYEAALTDDALHAVEHASFLGSALLMWALVFGSATSRGLPRPVALLLVFASGVQSSALGAVLLFASTALYPIHEAGAALWDVTPLQDQQLAGALMWGPPALLYIVTMGWLLVRWFADMDASQSSEPDRTLAPAGGPA